VLVDKKILVDTAEKHRQSDHPWIHDFFHGPRAEGAMKAKKANHGN
jgi:phospholipid/cholesterol/gamma-HCH transport system ATP-binding protein